MKDAMQKNNGHLKQEVYWIIPICLLLLFITWLVFISRNISFDNMVFSRVSPYINTGNTSFMKVITFLGNHEFLIPANLTLIAALLLLKKGNLAWRVAVVAVSSLGLKIVLKELFQRHRPDDPLVPGITNFSFPSGHAFNSVAFYGLLIWLVILYTGNKTAKKAVIILSALLILLIGFSRIYLRVHYATDVIAGFCIGIVWLWFCLWMTNKIKIGIRA